MHHNPPTPELNSRLDLLAAWIESSMAYQEIPGLSIGVVHDQDLIWSRGFGYADLETELPADERTLYRIASITKLFTATAIVQLRDAGKLQLDDPVFRHLPWFGVRNRFEEAPVITIRHLITHWSGLPREAAFPYWTENVFPTAAEIEQALGGQEVAVAPETQWKYSNLAVSLAGRVVEAATGQTYTAYVREKILLPLGMEQTLVSPSDPGTPGLAAGYGMKWPGTPRKTAPFSDCRGIAPAAGMASNIEDLARFASFQFRREPAANPTVLRGSSLDEMQRIQWLNPDWCSGRGLAFHIVRRDHRTLFGHAGALRGFRSSLVMNASDKVGAVVLANADGIDTWSIAERVFDWIAPALGAPDAARESGSPSSAWTAYVGRYRSDWGDEQVLVLDGTLALIDPRLPDPLTEVTWLHPVAEHAFRMETRAGSQSLGELARFEMDDAGRVVRLWQGNDYARPVSDW